MLKVKDIIVHVYSLQTLPQCYSFSSQAFDVFHHRFSLTPPRKTVNVGMFLLHVNFKHYQGVLWMCSRRDRWSLATYIDLQ